MNMDFELKKLPTNLRDQLYQIPLNNRDRVVYLNTKSIWMIAAGILLLIAVNLMAIQESRKTEELTSDLTVYNDYFYQYNAVR